MGVYWSLMSSAAGKCFLFPKHSPFRCVKTTFSLQILQENAVVCLWDILNCYCQECLYSVLGWVQLFFHLKPMYICLFITNLFASHREDMISSGGRGHVLFLEIIFIALFLFWRWYDAAEEFSDFLQLVLIKDVFYFCRVFILMIKTNAIVSPLEGILVK